MEELLMVPSQQMEKLIQYYKGELTENALLNKAARTAAKRDIILNSKLPSGIIKAKLKPLSRELHHLTKRVRRGPVGGLGGQLEEDDDDEEDDSLVTGPVDQVIKKIIKGTPVKKEIKKEIKTAPVKKATPSTTPRSGRRPLEDIREEIRERKTALKRRQTEVERLKTLPGWKIWDKPVKRKLKDDF